MIFKYFFQESFTPSFQCSFKELWNWNFSVRRFKLVIKVLLLSKLWQVKLDQYSNLVTIFLDFLNIQHLSK